jgi:hypothetical protein
VFRKVWFLQDGTMCHTTKNIMPFLCLKLGDQLTPWSRFITWSLHSPEDFFLWRNLKNEVYRNCPGCLNKLKVNTAEAISTINQDTLLAVTNNVLMWCQTFTDSQLQDGILMFKTLLYEGTNRRNR